ncbi:MAG TPA: type II toxin-antitoxin system VapB family antitoxin [Frankiaceae bacterium]|nr:type II toxin-antitoxin system VapB family antitoxin [Frankiaceae bacterium]
MTRTNIDIDDELVGRAMRRYRLPSKRAAVDLALRRLVTEPMTTEEMLALRGIGWEGDLDELRGRVKPLGRCSSPTPRRGWSTGGAPAAPPTSACRSSSGGARSCG